MSRISATEFKARCLELMDRVADRGETYVITKRGREVARLVPVAAEARSAHILGCLSHEMEIVGDVSIPEVPAGIWEETLREWDELTGVQRAAKTRGKGRVSR